MTGSAMHAIERDLAEGRTVVIDGATGTELERRGADMHDEAWCATATATHPEVLRGVHEDYVRAGARVVVANTFSTNRNMLDPAGLGDRSGVLNRRAVEIALEARERLGATDRVAVAGSMSHQVPVTRGADQRDPRSVPSAATVARNFHEMAGTLAEAGVDLIIMEMMSDPDLANPAIAAATATGLPVWVGFSVRLSDSGDPVSYSRPEMTAAEMFGAIPLDGAGVAGVMHSKADAIAPAMALLARRWSGPAMVYPDSGYFRMPHWQFVDIMLPDEFVERANGWIAAGAQVVGGCCGLGVEHIAALTAALGED